MRSVFRVGGELVDPDVSLAQRKQLAELLVQEISQIREDFERLVGGTPSVDVDGNLVLHGAAVPADFTAALLHRNLTGADLHNPKPHRATHVSGGSDAFAATDLLEAIIRRLRESGGATLLMGAVADGEFLRRSGTSVVGDATVVSAASFVDNAAPLEAPNDVRTTFTCPSTPSPAASLIWTINSNTYYQGIQYTLAGAVVTLAAGVPVPATGDEIRMWYRI